MFVEVFYSLFYLLLQGYGSQKALNCFDEPKLFFVSLPKGFSSAVHEDSSVVLSLFSKLQAFIYMWGFIQGYLRLNCCLVGAGLLGLAKKVSIVLPFHSAEVSPPLFPLTPEMIVFLGLCLTPGVVVGVSWPCSLSLWRVVRGSKLMHLDLIHGLFIT